VRVRLLLLLSAGRQLPAQESAHALIKIQRSKDFKGPEASRFPGLFLFCRGV